MGNLYRYFYQGQWSENNYILSDIEESNTTWADKQASKADPHLLQLAELSNRVFTRQLGLLTILKGKKREQEGDDNDK